VDRICPFLALAADLRSAMAGYDPEHRCLAQEPPPEVDRATQRTRCLTDEHLSCQWYVQRTAALAQQRRGARPAPDARFISTRLILQPDDGWRPMGLAARPLRRRRLALTGATLLALGAAAAALSTRGFGLMSAAALPTPDPTPSAESGATSQPTPSPTTAPTPRASVAVPTPTPRPATPSPRSTPHVYVAQAGDSLSKIAARFGVTVQALMAANGLGNPNLVNVGQVLVIPD
jgi:LysM repeat protein